MAQADRLFKQIIRKHFTNHEGNYPPSREIRLGDYGTLENGYYNRIGNIKSDFHVDFDERIDDNPTYEQFESAGEVTIKFMPKGNIGVGGIPLIKAGIELEFGADKSYFFSSPEVRYNEIGNLLDVGKKLIQLYHDGEWKKKFVLISKVIEGENLIMIISGSSNSSVIIEASSDDIPKIELSNASIKLEFGNTSKLSYKVIANKKAQMAFGLSKVYNPLFNSLEFKYVAKNEMFQQLDMNITNDENNLAFGDIIPDNYV